MREYDDKEFMKVFLYYLKDKPNLDEKDVEVVPDFTTLLQTYPMHFHTYAYEIGLKGKDASFAGTGVFYAHLLEKYAILQDPKHSYFYPTEIYVQVISSFIEHNEEKYLEAVEKYYEMLWWDVVFPNWKKDAKWYNPQIYENIIHNISKIVNGENHPFTQLLQENSYLLINECASHTLFSIIETKSYNIPTRFQ